MVLVVVVGVLSGVYLASRLRDQLPPALRLLTLENAPTPELLDAAHDGLSAASDTLRTLPARLLEVLPIARQNVHALRDSVAAGVDVIESLTDLEKTLESTFDGLVLGDAVDIGRLAALREPVETLGAKAQVLGDAAEGARSGWLLPPVYDTLARVARRAQRVVSASMNAVELVDQAPALLGSPAPRRYLVVLLNNAELRGAGGIPSGIGTVTIDEGRFRVGRFRYYADLAARSPNRRVRAPKDFARRFARYDANTPLWINTTFSPDLGDVALVSARLYRLATGDATDGVLFVDPRGLASILPPDASLSVPGTARLLPPAALPEYVYSDAYEQFDDQPRRREALVSIGREAFRFAMRELFEKRSAIEALARAVSGQHIRLVPFEDEERALARAIGLSGELQKPSSDVVLVTAQNLGGDKLDFWMRREVVQSCIIQARRSRCTTSVTLANHTPGDLPDYVAPAHRYGTAERLVDVYLPGSALIMGIDLDGEPVEVATEHEDGHTVIDVPLTIARGERKTLNVTYQLAHEGDYELIATPQPLAFDARLKVTLEAPDGWSLAGPGAIDGSALSYDGTFHRSLTFHAGPTETEGITALWTAFRRWLEQPLF